VLRGGEQAAVSETPAAPASGAAAAAGDLPPGHPPIDSREDWIGRSLLDDLLAADEPLRFENLRAAPGAAAPGGKSILTLRITAGGPSVADTWQIRMDAFGWVTAAYWAQGSAGPRLDELHATRRAEFRIAPASENALRAMAVLLFPVGERPGRMQPPEASPRIPRHLWPYEEPGRLDIDYRIETLDRADPSAWPGGQASVPLDLVQLLIGTWDDVPPRALRLAARDLAERHPLLMRAALFAEGVILALEVEGPPAQELGLPLRVGR